MSQFVAWETPNQRLPLHERSLRYLWLVFGGICTPERRTEGGEGRGGARCELCSLTLIYQNSVLSFNKIIIILLKLQRQNNMVSLLWPLHANVFRNS